MTALILQFFLMAGIIVAAGIALARSCDRIAELSGLGRTIIGMFLLAAATSLPEFTVAWNSVRIGAIDLTIGNVLGASLMNLAILAILDLVTRQRGRMLSRMTAAHALSAICSMMLTTITLLFILLDVHWTIWRFGPGTLIVLAAYLFSLRLIYFDQQAAAEPERAKGEPQRWWPPLLGLAAGATAILFAGPRLAHAADELAELTGLGLTFFGTVCVAVVTSLPEAVTTWESIRLGARDMAVGNIFGSNAFNMIVPVVGDLASAEPILGLASASNAVTAAAVILVTAVATLGLLYRAEKRYWMIEPDAALVLLLIVGAFVLIYVNRPV